MENAKKIGSLPKKCEGCGGNLIFAPKIQNLICEKCGKIYEFEKSNNVELHSLNGTKDSAAATKVEENRSFSCPSCGSHIVLTKYEISQNCPYCGTSLVVEQNEIKGASPDGIIPFLFDEEKAVEKFATQIKKKWYVPNDFKKKITADSVVGFYIPSFSFNATTKSEYCGKLYRDYVTKSGAHRDYFKVDGFFNQNYSNILVESSSKLNQKQLTGILPYNYDKKQSYDDAFIRGYSVEQYDTEVEKCMSTYKNILNGYIRRDILNKYRHDGVSYLNIQTQYSNETYSYYLVPIYKFDYKYKENDYLTYMNGETGRVDSNVPKSKVKITMVTIVVILIILIPIILGIIYGG